MSSIDEKEIPVERLTFYLKGTLAELWQLCCQLPEYTTKGDLFRDMLREFAGRRGLITKIKNKGENNADSPRT